MIGETILYVLPILLIWTLWSRGSPRHIFLTATFLWVGVIIPVLRLLRWIFVSAHVRQHDFWESRKLTWGLWLCVLAIWIAYPPLLVYVGDIAAIKDWNKTIKTVASLSGFLFVIILAIFFCVSNKYLKDLKS